MKRIAKEGIWFAVPLTDEGYAVGVVARIAKGGKIMLAYFFGPRRQEPPSLLDVESLRPEEAIAVMRVGDLGFVDGSWPVIGRAKNWLRTEWPIPRFIRREDLTDRAWAVQYSDDDPNIIVCETRVPDQTTGLAENSLLGSGAAEIILTRMLSI